MADSQLVIVFPDGQLVYPSGVFQVGLATSSGNTTGVFYTGGGQQGLFSGYGTGSSGSLAPTANYKTLVAIIQKLVSSQSTGVFYLNQMLRYQLTAVEPSTIPHGGGVATIDVYGSGFDALMVGNTIWIEDFIGGYDSNSLNYVVATIVDSTHLTATWVSAGDGGSNGQPCFMYYVDANGAIYGYVDGITVT